MYAGRRDVAVVAATYWFDPGTYSEDESMREMLYFPRQESPFVVRVAQHKQTGAWETFKYCGQRLVCNATAPDFDSAMLHTTMVGVDPDEPVDAPENGAR